MQNDLLNENDTLIKKINHSRGLVTQTTIDFQKSCNSILNRQNMLNSVAKEIEVHLKYYTEFQ